MMEHSCFFDSLPYKLVEILDTDELLYSSPRVIVLVFVQGRDELDSSPDHSERVEEAL